MCTVPCFQFPICYAATETTDLHYHMLSVPWSTLLNPHWDYKSTMHQNALLHILSLITKPTKPPLKLPICTTTCFQFHDLHYYTAQTTDMHYHMLSISWSTLWKHCWDYHAPKCTIGYFKPHHQTYQTATETTTMHQYALHHTFSFIIKRTKPLLTQWQYTEMLCIIFALTLSNFQECKLD